MLLKQRGALFGRSYGFRNILAPPIKAIYTPLPNSTEIPSLWLSKFQCNSYEGVIRLLTHPLFT